MTDPWFLIVGGVLVGVFLLWRLRRGERCFSGSARRDVYRRWNGRCAYRWVILHRCRGELHVDHQWPHSRGGRTRSMNGQILCAAINQRKGARHNWPFVLVRGVPVVGWLVYAVRWVRAEGIRR